MADCDRRCRCRFRAGVTRRPSAAGIVRSRAKACRGRCLSLRLALMPVAPVLAAPVLTTLGAIRAWGERAPEVLWFGRMR